MRHSNQSLVRKLAVLGSLATMAVAGENDKPVHVAQPVAPWSMSITNVAVKVCPDRTVRSAVQVATNTSYGQGDIVYNSAVRRYYMAVTAGNSGATNPVHTAGDVAYGGIAWRHFPSSMRNGFWLYNSGTNDITFGVGYIPTATKGGVLKASGTWYCDNMDIQGAIYAISTSATGTLQGVEF